MELSVVDNASVVGHLRGEQHWLCEVEPCVIEEAEAVEFALEEGKRLFTEALQCGTLQGFFYLISCFQTQFEPAFCGLASLSIILNVLAIDPCQQWKGPWRWFDESMLDCCEPLDKVKVEGITFGKLACLGIGFHSLPHPPSRGGGSDRWRRRSGGDGTGAAGVDRLELRGRQIWSCRATSSTVLETWSGIPSGSRAGSTASSC
ncbi:hypothetical protein E2562_008496 [Oryza meyeriana var. granulata]|uniref:glutathione gamma-glutamylcysteinyltransferase n=1 Tax=Oryza meyeriana var. granulata TaxID=110450 RepID=A0A6G1EHH2_9ORYZ|nr:hypothetical protein E2562_008496 [Oryza meyeriana var. granulata]